LTNVSFDRVATKPAFARAKKFRNLTAVNAAALYCMDNILAEPARLQPCSRAAPRESEDVMTGWHWPMTHEPPMVLLPRKVPPIGPELLPPIDATAPIPGDLPTPAFDPIEPPL
jgi:hypothetical protein